MPGAIVGALRPVPRATLAVALLAAWLSGCAVAPRAPVAATPAAPVFSLSGRLFASDGVRRFTAALRWTQSGSSRILLTTPLGQAIASIDVDASGARLTTANGRQYSAGSLSELMRRGLGLALPFEQLSWWVSGRAAPDTPAEALGEDGFSQQGWTVRYGARDASGRPLRLEAECIAPCTADAGRSAEGSGPPSVRLIVDQWLEP